MENKKLFFTNNFNLIRLFAAAQVAFYHIFSMLDVHVTYAHSLIIKILGLFPGVPIFFFISGYLISKSWESSKSSYQYFIKRALRIFPALFLSIMLALFLTYISGYFSSVAFTIQDILILIAAKMTILQFYNPDFLRHYGDGVMNGSLWTITVELQFYILIPIIYWIITKSTNRTLILSIFLILTLISNLAYKYFASEYPDYTLVKLFKVSFSAWIYMFIAGIIVQKNFELFYKYLAGRFIAILGCYFLASTIGLFLGADFGNAMNPILFFILILVIFSAAYSKPTLSDKILGSNDISYGVYIYHMPIVNYLIYNGLKGTYPYAILAIIATVSISFLSWRFIEEKFISLKNKRA